MAKKSKRNVILVHAGNRDQYQVALALHEAEMLKYLVTTTYFDLNNNFSKLVTHVFPKLKKKLLKRFISEIPGKFVISSVAYEVIRKSFKKISIIQNFLIYYTDNKIGQKAQKLCDEGDMIFSYNYYAYGAFSDIRKAKIKKILFQCHPHPATAKAILTEEMILNPEYTGSLEEEHEINYSQAFFKKLCEESSLADLIIAASSFTKRTLIENGNNENMIKVIPYGIDVTKFENPSRNYQQTLKILFVGSIVQRKGIKYLIHACKLAKLENFRLILCGRTHKLDDGLISEMDLPWLQIKMNVSLEELKKLYAEAHLFVFPSLVEGFAYVLLEAMASGLPVITTENTAGPDIVQNGREGFIVPIRNPEKIAEHLVYLDKNRDKLSEMGQAARKKAEQMTWKNFRLNIIDAVLSL